MRFPSARFSSTHHDRSRNGHHAMPYDRRPSGDDQRVRGIDALGTRHFSDHPDPPLTSRYNTRPAYSGPAEDCGREGSIDSDAILAPRDSHPDDEPFPHHLLPRPQSSAQHYHDTQIQRQRPTERSENPFRRRRRRESIPRNGESHPTPRTRDHKAARPLAYHSAYFRSPGRTPFEIVDRRPLRSRSPLASGQQRSQSPFADEPQPKRPRRDSSLRWPNREPYNARYAPHAAHSDCSSPSGDAFTTRREHRRSKQKVHRTTTPPVPKRGRSPSPRLGSNAIENPNLVPLGQRPLSQHDLDLLSATTHHSLSQLQPLASTTLSRGQPSISYIDNSGRRTPDSTFEEFSRSQPQLRETFWNERPEPFPRSTRRRQDRFPSQVEPSGLVSGANSIEVTMSARGNFRGSHGGHYNQGSHDSRNYTHSSGHGTPNSSAQGSPSAQSSHSGGRGSWNGQK